MHAKHPTVTVMTTNTETPARYTALLKELRDDAVPMATINGQALTLTFAFDDAHSWTLVGPLLDQLSNRNDQELLETETYGGRFARHEFLMASLETMWQLTGVVEAPDEWEQMMNLADDLRNAGGDHHRSFAAFADLVDHALLALQPETEDDHENTLVELQELDHSGAPRRDTVDWAHISLEFFMAYTGGTVDRIEYTYAGYGRTAVLTFVLDDGNEDHYELTAPANDTTAALMKHYYECHDALHPVPVPVMSKFNALHHADATAMLAALRTDADTVMLDEHTCPKDDTGNRSCLLLAGS